jgi:iron complex outermembrane recepter protein
MGNSPATEVDQNMAKTRAIILLGCSILTPAPLLAQTVAQAPEESTANDASDIVVTARKRAERLQDVPVAVTAFSSESIKEQRIERIADVAKLTPGLTFTPLFGAQNQIPVIRGAAQTFGVLNVGVFLDGIYLSGKPSADLELNDLERIEVVKGPQSALYGRNTFAGAINYVTKRPTQELSGSAELSVGANNLYKGSASISGPLSDTLRVRVGGYYRSFDGFYRSAIDNGRVDFAKSYGAIATVEWQPVPQLVATLRAAYSNDNLGQPPSSVIRTNFAPGRPPGSAVGTIRNLLYSGLVPAIPVNSVTVNTLPIALAVGTVPLTAFTPVSDYGQRQETIRLSGTLEYDVGPATLTSITSWFKRKTDFTLDGDNTVCDQTAGCASFGAAIPFGKSDLAISTQDITSTDFSQELRLASNGSGNLKWLVGAFYYNNQTTNIDRAFAPVTAAARDAFGFPNRMTPTESFSAFGSLGYRFGAVSVSGELRYEYETTAFRQAPTNPNVVPSATNPTVAPAIVSSAVFDLSQNTKFLTPRVIVDWKFADNKMLYASIARGVKAGGFNTNLNVTLAQRTFNAEKTTNYEIGLKTAWLDGRLVLNLAGYLTDWSDQQAACQNPVSFGGSSTQRTYTCNVASSKIVGLETSISWRMADWFTLSANHAFTHARYRAFIDDAHQTILAAAGLPPLDFTGKSLAFVPQHKFVISPQVNFDLGNDWTLNASTDVQYQSKSYVRADNLLVIGAKTLVDARVMVRRGPVSVQLFATNLLDNDTPVAGSRFFDTANFSVPAPLITGADRRQIGATFGYKF